MGFFQWLGSFGRYQWVSSLFDQLIAWLGEVVRNFVTKLIDRIQRDWYDKILPILTSELNVEAKILYLIFYAGSVLGETIMEIWDPRNLNKPPIPFKITLAPESSPLPRQRLEAKKLQLENWN